MCACVMSMLPSVFSADLASAYSQQYYNAKYSILPVYKLVAIACSIVFFHSAYVYASQWFENKHGQDFNDKREHVVSMLHSVLASVLASYILYFEHSLFSMPESYSEPIPFADVIFSISYGYFLWDIYISIATPHSLDFKIHAMFCTLVYSFATFSPFLHRPAIIVLLFEISTIFLQCSRIVSSRYKDSNCELCSRMLFMSSFFVFRIVIGSMVSFELWSIFVFESTDVDHKDIPVWFSRTILVINALFHVLNLYWFTYICKVAASSLLTNKRDTTV
mmetsp:Transcript_20137/g.32152  ORF Transcript_20137/g.32152 Transcript_20137/m.32152 type:complete len:277 (+) Transcript_20137:64-894(+)